MSAKDREMREAVKEAEYSARRKQEIKHESDIAEIEQRLTAEISEAEKALWLERKWEQEEKIETVAMQLVEAEAEREFAVNRAEQELRDAMAKMQQEQKVAEDRMAQVCTLCCCCLLLLLLLLLPSFFVLRAFSLSLFRLPPSAFRRPGLWPVLCNFVPRSGLEIGKVDISNFHTKN
jgi:hypothetical protein